MKFSNALIICCLSVYAVFAQNSQKRPDLPFIKGVYGNPGALLSEGQTFQKLGVNAVFVRSAVLNERFFNAAKQEGVRVYVEFPTLNGEEYLAEHPAAWPINEKGERAPQADWFMGICPTDQGFREYRFQQLRSILTQFPVDGIWLDYLHWHAQFETPDPILPETCFCNRCLSKFENDMGVKIPLGETPKKAMWILANNESNWRTWRSRVLTGWVVDMKTTVNELRPGALLGIFYCPWFPTDFNGALYKTMGLDLKALADVADVFSPMLYHRMMGRPTSWVHEYTLWLGTRSGIIKGESPLIWPIVQAHNKPDVVDAKEFLEVMQNGSTPPSSGVMMFSEGSMIEDPGKLEVMKQFYNKR